MCMGGGGLGCIFGSLLEYRWIGVTGAADFDEDRYRERLAALLHVPKALIILEEVSHAGVDVHVHVCMCM